MIKSLSTFLLFLFFLANCTSNSHQNKPIGPSKTARIDGYPVICTALYLPVCGKNAKTYSNACNAENAGVEFTQGECLPQK
jgi:hypothetical protein